MGVNVTSVLDEEVLDSRGGGGIGVNVTRGACDEGDSTAGAVTAGGGGGESVALEGGAVDSSSEDKSDSMPSDSELSPPASVSASAPSAPAFTPTTASTCREARSGVRFPARTRAVADGRGRRTVWVGGSSASESSSDESREKPNSKPDSKSEVSASSESESSSWRRARRAARLSMLLVWSQAWLRRRTVGPVTLMMSSSRPPSLLSEPHKQ